MPCPIKFDAKDLEEMAVVDKEVNLASFGFEVLKGQGGIGEEGWVPAENYKKAMAFCKKWRKRALASAESAQEREEIDGHWPWDDIDDEIYR